MLLHGACVELDGAGVLLRGPSGSGKSDLALRLIDRGGAWLVADDRVEIAVSGGRLLAGPPPRLAGLLEARGVGVVRMPHRAGVALAMVAELRPAGELERMPGPAFLELCGVSLPLIRLDAAQPSAPAKLRLALDMLRRGDRPVETLLE